MKKRGQMKISFGMIFSIILIIFFLAFAFIYVIPKFLNFQSDAMINQFYEHLGNDIQKVWTSTEASTVVTYNLPTSVKQVCFKNFPSYNVYLYEDKVVPGKELEHIQFAPFCTTVNQGKVSLTLEKSYGEAYVNVSSTS